MSRQRRARALWLLLTVLLVAVLPAPTRAAAGEAPLLRLRTGEHEGFSRLVFDWTAAVGYRVEREPGVAVVRFARPARLDLSRFRADRPAGVVALDAAEAEGGLEVRLTLAPGAGLRHVRDGPRVVIDGLNTTAGAAGLSASGRPAAKLIKRRANPILDDAIAAMSAEPARPGNGGAGRPAREEAAARPAASGKALGVVADYARPVPNEALPIPGGSAPRRLPLVMRLEWPKAVAAAAFRAGRHLWLVFDTPTRANLAKQIEKVAPDLAPVAQWSAGGATVLRLNAASDVIPELSRSGAVWTVDLRARSAATVRGAAVELTKAGVLLPAKGTGRLLALDDPDSTKRYYVVPVLPAGFGTPASREFPQFRALATYQGLVVERLSDAVRVRLRGAGLEVSSRTALLVSAQRGGEPHTAEPPEAPLAGRLFDPEAWRRGGPEDMLRNRQALQKAVVAAGSGPPLDLARLRLARFYFAHGLAAETLSALEVMTEVNKRLGRDPEVTLLHAASAFLAQDYRTAARHLAAPALAAEDEALVWRAALAAAAQDWTYAAELFDRTGPLIGAYARPVQMHLRLLAAEARLGIGDSGGASLYLDQTRKMAPGDFESARLDYLEGRRLLIDGEEESALALWHQVAASSHLPSRARARLALLDHQRQSGALDDAAAIEELERLRFVWRGDSFEVALLERLAGLYAATGDHRSALHALRQAASHFPESARARAATARMSEIFQGVFLGEAAATVPAVKALALFQEFEELTPVGRDGQRVIAALVDRLVEIDLLDRAAALLEEQIERRLEGREKAEAGARLALIRLLDRAPAQALEGLAASAIRSPPAALERRRRHLQVQALARLERGREALGLLAGDDSPDARRLRAEILWNLQDWPAAAVALGRLLPAPPGSDGSLAPAEGAAVANLAIAQTLAGNRKALNQLKARYGAAMAGTPQGESFGLLTSDFGHADVTAIAEELAGVERIQTFLAGYKARVAEAALSGVN